MARGLGKAREYDYSNVGTAGRRTGLTLKEGRRDEHGMEEVDGLFSSPEKSPDKMNGFEEDDDEDSIGSDMSIEDDNAPGPMHFLNASNRSQNLPPPSQSPVKGSSRNVRRSPVVQSSPEPEQDFSSPSEGRSLLATNGNLRGDPSPLSARSVNAGPKKGKNNSQKARALPETTEFSDEENDENTSFAIQDDVENSFDHGNDTVIQDEIPEPIEQDLDDSDSDHSDAPEEPQQAEKATKPTKKGPAAKPTSNGKGKSAAGRPGRPPKAARAADEETPEARPAKKQRVSKEAQPQEPLDPELDRVVENYSQRSGPLKGRSLYILKRENPTEDVSTHTRSGRVSVRPLAYWRNERCVYGDGEAAEGQRYPLSTIKEIIRTEEQEPDNKGKGKRGRKSKSSKSKKRKEDFSDDEDENVDEWETQGGILHGIVPKWDPIGGTSEDVTDTIAYAPSGIQTKGVKGSTFKFAKLLSSSFIGSGVLDLPPDSLKKPKNSKKMHMVFYVCNGRVQVDISGVQFSAGKGCVFQVPRGNVYSFANPYEKDVRLFFTQGCVPDEDSEEDSGTTSQAVEQGNSDGETEAEAGPSKPKPKAKPAATRGRKGKQKAGK
ncbi:unnamed protein product [Penicillium pancosmium]